jgi:hypothetical protein
VADPSVAKVDATGTVLPVAKGSTMVTASVTYQGVTKSSSFPVVVEGTDASEPVMNLADRTVTLDQAGAVSNPASVQLLPSGDSVTGVSYQIAPMDAGYGDATIDAATGILSTTKAGTYRITATATISNYGPADSAGNPTDGYLSRSAIVTVTDNAAPVLKAMKSHAPAIQGTAKVGKTLTVKTYKSGWTKGATLTATWFVAGEPVKTGTSLELTQAYKGKMVFVSVTGTKTGFESMTRTSKSKKIKK